MTFCENCKGEGWLDTGKPELERCEVCKGEGKPPVQWSCLKCGEPNNELKPCLKCGSDLMVASS